MFDTIKEQIENGMPVLATCAGLILLASEVEGQEGCHFGTIPMCVRRNAYGRQLGSFHTVAEVKGVGEVPMTFIRAPYVAETGDGVEVLATVDGKIVRRQDEIGTPFCVTYDFDSETDGAVTVRDRDTMEQERVKIEDLRAYLAKKMEF